MEPVRVWTKQHAGVAEELARTGVYRAKGRYIALDLKEHAPLVLEVYDWLVAHTPAAPHRPEGAEYPVWVSFLREGTMLPGEGAVILELELDPELITRINVAKWGAMLNYAYLPRDEADARRHRKLLSDYGASDARAFMTSFYPQIKREILDSWQRLFRHHAALGMGDRTGVGGAPFPKKRTVKTEKKRNEIVEMRDREIKRRRYREKPQSERETASRGQNGDAQSCRRPPGRQICRSEPRCGSGNA